MQLFVNEPTRSKVQGMEKWTNLYYFYLFSYFVKQALFFKLLITPSLVIYSLQLLAVLAICNHYNL